MSKWLKWTGLSLLFLVLVLVGLAGTALGWRTFGRAVLGPEMRTPTDRTFESTLERMERGQYLVEGPMHCYSCHSPAEGDMKGAGTPFEMVGLPGEIFISNITPDPETGLGNWTDDEIARAIREGVSRDGRTLFPLMPYSLFRELSDEDLASVIVYIRSVPAIRNAVPRPRINFPVSRLINADPRPLTEVVAEPDRSDPVAYGGYLVRLSNCITCHTAPDPAMHPREDLFLAGGFELNGAWGHVFGPNITPDASGISYYDEARFLEVLRTGKVGARVLNPIMPVAHYRDMPEEDLKAIYAYLGSLKPIKHVVDNTEEKTFCKVCNGTHGYGDRN